MENKIKILIPNERFKMTVIGNNGLNIKTFQEVTGVKVTIDDTPGAIFLEEADFDKLKVARNIMDRLVRENKITPELIQKNKEIYGK
jgi:polyribonucleotide nucleotidyltransferase